MPAEILADQAWQRGQIPTPKVLRTCLRTDLFERLAHDHRRRCEELTCKFLGEVEIVGILQHVVSMKEAVRIAFSCAVLYAGRPDLDFPPPVKVRVSPLMFDENYLPTEAKGRWAGYVSARTAEVWLSTRMLHHSFKEHDGYHMPIHEFAHVLDFGILEPTRRADGIPRDLSLLKRAAWSRVLNRVRSRAGVKTDIFTMDPHAKNNAAEAFACATEAFFEQPRALRTWDDELYAMLSEFFRQDPAGAF